MWTVKFVGDAYGEKPKVFGCRPTGNFNRYLDFKSNTLLCVAFDRKHADK